MITRSTTGFRPFMDAMWQVEERVARARDRPKPPADPIRICAIDPGTLSGLAQIWVSPKTGKVNAWIETILAYDELQQVRDMHDWINEVHSMHSKSEMLLAIEDFRVNKVNGAEEFLSPVRIGRRLEGMLMAGDTGLLQNLHWFMPARKAEFTDERLRALKMYTPGPDHRRDATRHALIARKYALQTRGI